MDEGGGGRGVARRTCFLVYDKKSFEILSSMSVYSVIINYNASEVALAFFHMLSNESASSG